MTESVLQLVVEVLLVLFWITVALVALVLLLVLWPFVREAHGGPRRRRGIAPPAVLDDCEITQSPIRLVEELFPNAPVETRLMPGANQGDPGDETSVPEGLGIMRPREIARRRHSPLVSWWDLDASARLAVDDARRALEAHS